MTQEEINKVRSRMAEKNISQTELAEKLGISQVMVSKYLSGKSIPKLETLVSMAKLLDLNPEEICPKLHEIFTVIDPKKEDAKMKNQINQNGGFNTVEVQEIAANTAVAMMCQIRLNMIKKVRALKLDQGLTDKLIDIIIDTTTKG